MLSHVAERLAVNEKIIGRKKNKNLCLISFSHHVYYGFLVCHHVFNCLTCITKISLYFIFLQFHLHQAKMRSKIRIHDGRGMFSLL